MNKESVEIIKIKIEKYCRRMITPMHDKKPVMAHLSTL